MSAFREQVVTIAQQLNMISDKLIRRAALEQPSLAPCRAEEWAVVIRGAEALLAAYADELTRGAARQRLAARCPDLVFPMVDPAVGMEVVE